MIRKLMTVTLLAVVLVTAGCQTSTTQEGAILGGALGAGAGAIIGNQSGRAGEGALIGAGAGALTGALVGDHVGRRRAENAQQVRPPQAPPPAPAAAPTPPTQVVEGHYETRIVVTPSGERYEERVWVPHR